MFPRSVPVLIYLTARAEREVNFNVACNVRRRSLPLTLNVKAEGYSMTCAVQCEDLQGNRVQLSTAGLSLINLGQVRV